jgi:hypothetical protein
MVPRKKVSAFVMRSSCSALSVADLGEDAIDPDPAAGGELDGEHADRLIRGEGVQRITGARHGADA